MGLNLTKKGSILDALGGAVNTGANAVVAGTKDLGDLASQGLGAATGNQVAVQNAQKAIQNNDKNLTSESLPENLGGLSEDTGITPAVRAGVATGAGLGLDVGNTLTDQNLTPSEYSEQHSGLLDDAVNFASNKGRANIGNPRQLAGNAIATGVNLVTAEKGAVLEKGAEDLISSRLGNNLASRVAGRVIGGATTAGAYGAGQGAAQAVQTAKNPKQAAEMIAKSTGENALIGGVTGGITKIPDVVKTAKDNLKPLDEVGGVNNRPVAGALETDENGEPLPTPPSRSDTAKSNYAAQVLKQDMETPGIDWTQVQGANTEYNSTLQNVANTLREQDKMLRPQSTNLYQQIRENGGIGSSSYEDIPLHLKNKGGMSMDKLAQTLGYKSDEDLHDALGHEAEQRAKSKVPLKSAAEYKEVAKQYIHQHPEEFNNVEARAKAENDVNDYQKADKQTGYNKAKHQIPKGTSAKKFIQALYDKTHSPEYRDLREKGGRLEDTRNTLKVTKKLRDQTDKELNAMTKRGGHVDAATVRAKAAELRSHNTRYHALQSIEQQHGLDYHYAKRALDDKYPDFELTPGSHKGIHVTSAARPEIAKPVEPKNTLPTSSLTSYEGAPDTARVEEYKKKIQAGEEIEPIKVMRDSSGAMGIEDGKHRYEAFKQLGIPNVPIEDVTPARVKVAASKTTAAVESAVPPEAEKELSPMDKREMGRALGLTDEQMDKADADEAEKRNPERNANGDAAILDGIKRGDSDAAILKDYMEATGSDLDEAKKAYGALEDDPNADTTGKIENNPLHGKLADYDIEGGPKKGLRKVIARGITTNKRLLNKALLRSTAYGDHLAYKLQDASHLWTKLSDEAQGAADQLRGHSAESIAEKLPEEDRENFLNYATRVKDIQDYIHEARGISDPYDITPYRQNYGARMHVENDSGKPVDLEDYLGKEESFQKARHFNDYGELEKNTGLKRSTQDFHEDLSKDVVSAQHHIAPHNLYNGLRQAFGDDAVSYGKRTTEATTELKDFPSVFTAPDVAERINSRATYSYDPDAIGTALKGYDKLNASMKNVKLSLGGFHNINEMLNQLALNPSGAGSTTRALVDSQYFRDKMNEWDKNGTMEKALHSGLTLGGGEEGSVISKIPGVKQAHDALFGRQIPISKMQVFEKYAKDLDLSNPGDYDQMRGIARGINNTFGGINRLVDGLSATRMKQLSRVTLAEDYNEGQIRTLLSSISKGGIEGRMARQVVIGRAMILATPGIIQAIATHKIGNSPQDIAKFVANQLVNPTVQTPFKTPGGTPKQISLVGGIVNKIDRAVAPGFDKNNPDKLSGLQSELSGNLAPGASAAQEELTNKDYYGNKLHGGGMNAAEDVGAALNTATPIPFSPAGRALEGTHFKDNPVVKLISGGQSAISPEEAAVDISGAGRVAANPNAPVMQIMNNRTDMYKGLSTDDQAALDNVHPSWNPNATKGSEAAIYKNKQYEINKWNVLRSNTNIYNVLKKQNSFAAAHGEPSDPLFSLNKKDYDTLTEYEFLKHADMGTDANNTAAVMYAQNAKMINGYETAESKYQTQMNALYSKSGGVQGNNEPAFQVGGAPEYKESPEQTNLSNQYFAMNDSNSTGAQRADFLNNNPQLTTLFTAQFNAENEIRKQQNEPLLKGYPEPSTSLNNWMNDYIAASKTARTSLRTANPTLYNQMSDYMGQVDAYELSKTAGQAQFVGQNLTQKNLKQIYDLGQYDIAPDTDSAGNTSYSLNPQAAYTASQNTGEGSLVKELEQNEQKREAVAGVKYAGETKRIKVRKMPEYRAPKKVRIKNGGAPKVKVVSRPTQ